MGWGGDLIIWMNVVPNVAHGKPFEDFVSMIPYLKKKKDMIIIKDEKTPKYSGVHFLMHLLNLTNNLISSRLIPSSSYSLL